MNIDLFTLVASGVMLLLALVAPQLSPFRRRPSEDPQAGGVTPEPGDYPLPAITLIVAAQGHSSQLDEHLPLYLTQDYAPGYEVIVVGEKSDPTTENVLKRYSGNPLLYTTYVPESARYMSRNKLAITLGVKAAHNEWIVLTDPSCKPLGNLWLRHLAEGMSDGTLLVMGYSNYTEEAPDYYRFEHLHTALSSLHEAEYSTAYRTNCYNIAFRKTHFMGTDGFASNLKFTIGVFDFLVNKYAAEGNVSLVLNKQAWVIEDVPTKKQWENKHIFYQEVRKHLSRSHSHRLKRNANTLFLHLSYCLPLILGIWGGLSARWILLGSCVLSLLLTTIIRTVSAKRVLEQYDEPIATFKIVPYELSMLWRTLRNKIRYENADKYDFISHKV